MDTPTTHDILVHVTCTSTLSMALYMYKIHKHSNVVGGREEGRKGGRGEGKKERGRERKSKAVEGGREGGREGGKERREARSEGESKFITYPS